MPKLFCIFFLLLFPINPPSFSLQISPTTTSITLYGDAHFDKNFISLTQQLPCFSIYSSPPFSSGFGSAFYAHPFRFLDPKTNATASFSSQFSIKITPSSPFYCPFGDGLAFLIISNMGLLGYSNGYLGFPRLGQTEDDAFFAVEFDTKFDPFLGDINGNHVSVDVGSVVSVASADVGVKGVDLRSGREMFVWIDYNDLEKIIRVWVGYEESVRPFSPVLVSGIDPSDHFKEFMFVGFSASNGRGSSVHIVDKWDFKTYGILSRTMPMSTFQEEGCVNCLPREWRKESEVIGSSNVDKRVMRLVIEVGGFVMFVLFVFGIVGLVYVFVVKRNRLFKKCNEAQICTVQGTNRMPKRLSLTEIRAATKGFKKNRIIGVGGSAVVYEGNLPGCGNVAVKRFSEVKQIGSLRNNPFTTEFGTMVDCLSHKNLIQLHGWCCERNELILVYQYMPNGSLDRLLHTCTNAGKVLSWERRVSIVLGVASALVHLHEECERQIIHRDVKTCNIMLDSEFNAKLGDFGLAEIYEHSCRTRDATLPAGTMGYLAPEYVYSGIPNVKTDVYSFGVVLLEVASGRRPVGDDRIVLTDWIWNMWEKGSLVQAVDPKLKGSCKWMEVERMLVVGLSCVHPNYEKRPTMKEAARMLKGEMPLFNLPKKKPTVKIHSFLPEDCEDIMKCGVELDETPWSTPKTHLSKH